jgi:hypothetical protein
MERWRRGGGVLIEDEGFSGSLILEGSEVGGGGVSLAPVA